MPYKIKHKDKIKFYENLGDDLRSYYGGALCHCNMCGWNNADKYNRNIYLRNGFAPAEQLKTEEKRQNRKRLRMKLKNQLRNCNEY